ncbi:MAG: ChaB family protein [Fidelibacterota bacterium]
MPYDDINKLPKSVRNPLPKKAQKIFLAAYNNAWDQYKNKEDRQGDDSRETVAMKVAWSAVKQNYEKKNGDWQPKK